MADKTPEPTADEPATGEEVPPSEEVEDELPPPVIDLTNYPLKTDFFESMHMLEPSVEKINGAANFRQINGFPVYGVGQPTEEGIKAVIDKIDAGKDESENKLLWFNMRLEPIVYVNGTPYAPRTEDNLHNNIEIKATEEEIENVEKHFVKILEQRRQENPEGVIKIQKDQAYIENPMERENKEDEIKVETIQAFGTLIKGLQENGYSKLEPARIPIVEERSPCEDCFDKIVSILKDEPASTICLFSCQMGRGRTTIGMIVACLIKEIQITSELRKMGEIGLIPAETVDDLIRQKFETPLPRSQDDDDPFIKGEFDVIKELLEKLPESKDGKTKIDRVIDICGGPPKGSGLQNLRECVIETKWKYDVAPEEKQVVWKSMILNFMERYFYLICFGTYALQYGSDGFKKTFKEWMNEHQELRGMISEGKDRLEWYRQVDPAKLNTLKELIAAPDYKDKLGTLIRTIYDFAFLTYADLPRGPIKNNSMRKLAAKTLMEILPPDIAERVNRKLDEDPNTSHDFVTLVGLVSYYGDQP
ncbi:paladin [Eurytemora carolleeae]|uniref:paladin n=1 Tax=Eurytemora carolleeae TaxID=1294199 RepID=UPI000C7698FA|nr:paladin [Eurytemora carolleeae]|eukprot:XP_023349377.1 paladin-like [Eurytemora affinis]